jgi:putative ABC transport system substrate-binding protein
MNVEVGAKRLGLLHELLPRALRFGVLDDPNVPAFKSNIATAQAWAASIGLAVELLTASTDREISEAFARAISKRVDALMILPALIFLPRRVQLTTLAARHGVPTIFGDRSFAEVGGLMSYSASATDQYFQAGVYVGRILRGAKPADLPILQPTKYELVINLKTAKALGLTIPETLLATADEVIQ